MRKLLAVLLVLAGLLVTMAEPLAPTAELVAPARLGSSGTVTVRAYDRGRGLASVEVRLIPAAGATVVLAQRRFPLRSWMGSGVHEVELTAAAAEHSLPEGPAVLEVRATDHSWLALVRGDLAASAAVDVDVTPPRVETLSAAPTLDVGGSACVVYRVSDDTVASGVRVGELLFEGTAGYFADGALRVALFTVPPSVPDARPVLAASDAAGNERALALDVRVRVPTFRERTLELSDGFLERKVPALLAEAGLPPASDLLQGYLRINRELRAATESTVRQTCSRTTPKRGWSGSFLRLPNSASLSRFGDRRAYRYQGEIVDRQMHLGFDLASVQGAPVPAANAGLVVHTGPLGIYGETVVLDHGLGLFTLYGHLRAIDVTVGSAVERGQQVGRTGETGLAGGDHLHFSVMLHGVHVDPVEWWDARWIRDHVLARLEAYPAAAP